MNYTGCDSLYSTAADSFLVYMGGHQRWFDNGSACDSAGPGAIPAPGMAGLNPTTGALFTNSAGTAGYYSRARGLGADDMLITGAGLWIASDNFEGSASCGGVQGHRRHLLPPVQLGGDGIANVDGFAYCTSAAWAGAVAR